MTSLSPAYSAPVSETGPVRSQKLNDSTDTVWILEEGVKPCSLKRHK